MADSSDTTEERTVEAESEVETADSAVEEEAVVDLDAADQRERSVEALEEEVEEQRERIEELEDLVLDLSVRVADDRAMGVCPDCHGPVIKKTRWLGRNTIECTRCGRTFHEY
jgi:predicted RNase H-like nuclease (RuvC/YqgF family)